MTQEVMTQEVMYVGIDVSSEKLDVSFVDGDREQIRPTTTVENGPSGWQELTETLVTMARERGEDVRLVCGMESTGNFHKRVEHALRCETRIALEVHVINPMAIKHFGKALLQDAKTDRLDSILIARYLQCIQPKPEFRASEGVEELREATRTRRRFVEERTQHKNRLHKLLRVHFPGYQKALGKEITKQLLVTIGDMSSPDKILDKTVAQIVELRTGPRHQVRAGFAERLRKLAELAPHKSLQPTTRILLRSTAHRILELGELLAELDAAIETTLAELYPDHHLRSIPGIGNVSAAAILAEVGDIKRFTTVDDFIGYCGLYPVVWESGKAKRRYKMTYKGNRMLKMTFLVVVGPALLRNPAVAAFHARLLRRGKSTKAAGGACARKLAQLAYCILTKDEPWSDEIAQRGIRRGEQMASATS